MTKRPNRKALAASGLAHQQISAHVIAAACTGFVVTISDDALAGRLSGLKLEITATLMPPRTTPCP